MALIPIPYDSSDEQMLSTTAGLNLFPSGAFYVQYGKTSTITTGQTASVLDANFAVQLPAQGATTYITKGSQKVLYNSPLITQSNIGQGTLAIGTLYRIRVYGTYATGACTTAFQIVLTNNRTGATTNLFSANTAASVGTVAAGGGDMLIEADFVVTGTGTSGSIYSRGNEFVTLTSNTQGQYNAPATSITIDTTQDYTVDVQMVQGTAPTLTIRAVKMELLA